MFSRLLHNFKEVNDIYTEIPQDLIDRLIQRGKGYGISISVNGDARAIKPPASTCSQWQMPYIFPDGTVIPCCNPNEANMRKWQRESSMGNIFKTPFREIWEGEKYRKLRDSLYLKKREDFSPICRTLCAIHDTSEFTGGTC
jgi:MoaA/NifB/PqqE/SkfB family radical SAM enzyme